MHRNDFLVPRFGAALWLSGGRASDLGLGVSFGIDSCPPCSWRTEGPWACSSWQPSARMRRCCARQPPWRSSSTFRRAARSRVAAPRSWGPRAPKPWKRQQSTTACVESRWNPKVGIRMGAGRGGWSRTDLLDASAAYSGEKSPKALQTSAQTPRAPSLRSCCTKPVAGAYP